MVSLLDDMARCLGHGAGPSGHQNRADCVNCVRRLAPRAGDVVFMEPPAEFPCPVRIGADHYGKPCRCGAGTMGDCVANTCAKVQAAAGMKVIGNV